MQVVKMTESFEEKRATINGHEIAIQCLIMDIGKTLREKKLHYHSYIELIFMLSGKTCVCTGVHEINADEGDLVVINSKEPHTIQGLSDNCKYIVIKFKPQLLYTSEFSVFEMRYLAPFVISGDLQRRVFKKSDFGDFNILSLMKGILDEWNGKLLGYEMLMRADILRLFTWIIRYWSKMKLYDIDRIDSCNPVCAPIKKVLELTTHSKSCISCEDAAKYCGMSYSYFSRSFKSMMGMSYTEYLTHLRINEADRMLATTDKTVTEIAQQTGFSSDAYLISCFKKIKGLTPGQYRALLRK